MSSNLIERVWLRLSTENKDRLNKQAQKNKRNMSQEADSILDTYFEEKWQKQ